MPGTETNVTVQFVADTTPIAAGLTQVKEDIAALGATKVNVFDGAATGITPVITALEKVKSEVAQINATPIQIKVEQTGAAYMPIGSPEYVAHNAARAAARRESMAAEMAQTAQARSAGGKTKADDYFDDVKAKGAADGLKNVGAAADEAGPKIKSFGAMMREIRVDLLGVLMVAGAVKYALDQAASVETGKMHLGNILGDPGATDQVVSGLKKVSDQSNYSIASLEEEASKLAASGMAPTVLTSSLSGLAATARATGSDLGEIVDVYDRMRLHGEVTAREMTRLTMASGGSTRALAEQFAHLKGDVAAAKAAIEEAAKSEAEAYKITEHHTETVNSLEEKLGITAAVFKAWSANMNQDSVREIPGFHGTQIQAMGAEQIAQFKLGIREIAGELHLSEGDVAQFFRTGQLGAEDALAAAKRYREAIQEVTQAKARAQELKLVQQGQAEEFKIFDQVSAAITNMKGSEEGLAAYQATFTGQMQKQMKELNETIAAGTTPIIQNFKAVEVVLGLALAGFAALKAVQFVQWGMEIAASMAKAQTAIEGTTAAAKALTAVEATQGGAAVAEGVAGGAAAAEGTSALGIAAAAVVTAFATLAGAAIVTAVAIGGYKVATAQGEEKRGNDRLDEQLSWARSHAGAGQDALDAHMAEWDQAHPSAGMIENAKDPHRIASDSTGFGPNGPSRPAQTGSASAREWAQKELDRWSSPDELAARQAAQLVKDQENQAAAAKARQDALIAASQPAAVPEAPMTALEARTGVRGITTDAQGYEVLPAQTSGRATDQYKPTGGAGAGGAASTFDAMYHQAYLQSIGNDRPIIPQEYKPQWTAPPPMQNDPPTSSSGTNGSDPGLAPLAKIEENTAYLKDLIQMLQVA